MTMTMTERTSHQNYTMQSGGGAASLGRDFVQIDRAALRRNLDVIGAAIAVLENSHAMDCTWSKVQKGLDAMPEVVHQQDKSLREVIGDLTHLVRIAGPNSPIGTTGVRILKSLGVTDPYGLIFSELRKATERREADLRASDLAITRQHQTQRHHDSVQLQTESSDLANRRFAAPGA